MTEKRIFERIKLGDFVVKNRLIRSATWEGMALEDGSISEALMHTYQELAKGGVGAIITGFTSVVDEDHYFDGIMRLSNDSLIPQYKRLTDTVHQYDCRIITQLALSGYFKRIGCNYALTDIDGMDTDDIAVVIHKFGEAAVRAKQAGFDGVQIHAAHFFFLNRFISPATNHRTDAYGGSMENRSRILLEILKKIKEKASGLHVTMKINLSDMIYGGLEPEESIQITKLMADAGLDSVEVSANGTSVAGIKAGVNEGYFFEYGSMLAEQVSIPVILVGGHRSMEHMEKILNKSRIECLSLSRPLISEPELPNRWQSGDKAPAKCVSCNACYRTPNHKCIFAFRGQK